MLIDLKMLTSSQQRDEHNPAWPEVCGLGLVLLVHQHLWGHVGLRATAPVQQPLLAVVAEEGGQAKVGYFEGVRAVQQQVLGLQVSMSDASTVQIALRQTKTNCKMHRMSNLMHFLFKKQKNYIINLELGTKKWIDMHTIFKTLLRLDMYKK